MFVVSHLVFKGFTMEIESWKIFQKFLIRERFYSRMICNLGYSSIFKGFFCYSSLSAQCCGNATFRIDSFIWSKLTSNQLLFPVNARLLVFPHRNMFSSLKNSQEDLWMAPGTVSGGLLLPWQLWGKWSMLELCRLRESVFGFGWLRIAFLPQQGSSLN